MIFTLTLSSGLCPGQLAYSHSLSLLLTVHILIIAVIMCYKSLALEDFLVSKEN